MTPQNIFQRRILISDKIVHQFKRFIKDVDDEILSGITEPRNRPLTDCLSNISHRLWMSYKDINGTSAGFYGIDEYIVFSSFKSFIEYHNKPLKFQPRILNKDLRFFELNKRNRSLHIYRSAKLSHLPKDSKAQLLKEKAKYRTPDIVILKTEEGHFKLIAVIEVKNYLDKGNTESGIEILLQVNDTVKDPDTKYALYSFSRIAVRDAKTLEKLIKFQKEKNNYLITKKDGIKGLEIIDLSDFFDVLKDDIKI